MKKKILAVLICIFVVWLAVAMSGKFAKIDRSLNLAFRHARNYPPEFSSQKQRIRVTTKLQVAMVTLAQMLKDSGPDPEVLFRLGKANTFAYNLDIKGSQQKADQYFRQLFELEPDHAEGHLYYGQHLSSRGEAGSSIRHLKIAADAGKDTALTMLGLAYLNMKRNDEARKYFLKFQELHPRDAQVQMILDSLDGSGEYQVEVMRR
jgi:tetratricopeptide (TPR) repeat protein